MVSNYDQRRQVSPEYLGALRAQCRGSVLLLLLILTICFRRLPRNLKATTITDKADFRFMTGGLESLNVACEHTLFSLSHSNTQPLRQPWLRLWRFVEQAGRWCRPHRQSRSQRPRPALLSGTCWTWLLTRTQRNFVSKRYIKTKYRLVLWLNLITTSETENKDLLSVQVNSTWIYNVKLTKSSTLKYTVQRIPNCQTSSLSIQKHWSHER